MCIKNVDVYVTMLPRDFFLLPSVVSCVIKLRPHLRCLLLRRWTFLFFPSPETPVLQARFRSMILCSTRSQLFCLHVTRLLINKSVAFNASRKWPYALRMAWSHLEYFCATACLVFLILENVMNFQLNSYFSIFTKREKFGIPSLCRGATRNFRGQSSDGCIMAQWRRIWSF